MDEGRKEGGDFLSGCVGGWKLKQKGNPKWSDPTPVCLAPRFPNLKLGFSQANQDGWSAYLTTITIPTANKISVDQALF